MKAGMRRAYAGHADSASALSKALVENTLGEEVRHVLAGPDVLEVVLVEEAVVLED